MRRKSLGLSFAIIAFLGLSGCGGESSSNSITSVDVTGEFIDAAVTGLNYRCSSGKEGITDTNGYFKCKENDEINFSINGFALGSTKVQKIITPMTLAPDNNITVTNIAQLLQTLDSDANPDNGITLNQDDEKVKALENINVSLDAVDFDSVIASYIGRPLVDESAAMSHLELSVKNAENDRGVTSNSIVTITTGLTQEYCSNQTYASLTYDGYSTYEEFVNAGGSVSIECFPTTKSCSEYSTAGVCNVEKSSIEGDGSCVTIVTYPKATITLTQTANPPVLAYSFSADEDHDIEYFGNDSYFSITNSDVSLIDARDHNLIWKYSAVENPEDIKFVGVTNNTVIINVIGSDVSKIVYLDRTDGTVSNIILINPDFMNLRKFNEDGTLILADRVDESAVFDSTTGRILFRIKGGLSANIAINDNTIVSSSDHKLFAYDLNGNQLWENNVSCTGNLIIDNTNAYCAPFVDNNTTGLIKVSLDDGAVVAQNNSYKIYDNRLQQTEDTIYTMFSSWYDYTLHQKLVAISKDSLTEKWSVNINGRVVVGIDISKKLVYLIDDKGYLQAYNTEDGTSIFSINLDTSSYDIMDFNVEDDGSLFIKGNSDEGYEYKIFKYE